MGDDGGVDGDWDVYGWVHGIGWIVDWEGGWMWDVDAAWMDGWYWGMYG